MASVYYLFDDATDIADSIIYSTEAKYELDKKRYFAALIIQRTFRGFAVRCEYKRCIHAAIVIQKHFRGYLLRLHLPEIATVAFRRKCLSIFNKMATKIQALWRGYWTRKTVKIEEIIAEKREEQDAHDAIKKFFDKVFTKGPEIESDISLAFEDLTEEERYEKKVAKSSPEILKYLFEKHHLLRTYQIEGVLSIHKSKELSMLEKFLTQLDAKTYINNMRKIYRETEEPKVDYMFTNKTARKLEDLIRLRNHREGKMKMKHMYEEIDKPLIHSKPFIRTSKIKEKPYKRHLMSHEEYTGIKLPVFRDRVKPDISRHDFNLSVHHIKKHAKDELPPYYIDHWKKMCCDHNFMFDFMENRDG
ncbi:hypothetical protein HHI36_021910 [Cryptolaemus montrouzieri]|uniref:Spermatogenesis-associated protein 17 n=1 Tax=Cryptolaemus montrouzieri TaxID=559131 RepID=A0ABD2MZ01_9CUCU